ncbi:T9SS C-terminal target domain-containing protein [Lutibacter sp. HS1-25]|uniref:LamG-like jellyroll fold domain-containing protein n=1 Tax=Lutibacter sp. HS1-25 TaxID=2485000 RepID=UPI00101292CA|nr:LamG-like jellyroll fold domain-containing protein [Lutibacter sp. HS1-25]RXP46587.1 T9SS C-terminal target domain-containing protein [Lutibacter sp. HS1-25]
MKTKIFFLTFLFNAFFTLNAQTGLTFDGTNEYIVGTNNSSLQLTQGTVEAWIKTSGAGNSYRAIIAKSYNYGIFLNYNELIAFEWISGRLIKTGVNLADGIWHHVAFTFDDEVTNGSKLYVDGVSVLTFTYNVANFNYSIGVGNQTTNTFQHFNGEIDQARVWNTVRTDAEILNNYNKCLNGDESNLVMLWQFEEGTGTTVTDLSGNENHGTLQNISDTNWVSGYNCKPSELIAHYPFNGNANDESGNANHGTVNGATLTTDRFGNENSAYSFDGNDVITINHNNLLNFDNELSISVWIKPNAQQNAMILGKSNYSTATNFVLRTRSNNFIEYAHKTRNFSDNNPLNLGEWNHIAVISHSTGEREIFINNHLTSFTSQSDVYGLVSNPITIGAAYHFGSYFAEFFNGAIDDLKIYNKALTANEVAALYDTSTAGIDDFKQLETNFYVFENVLYFKKTQNISEIKSIEVYNLLGQKAFNTSKITHKIHFNNLQKGIYILKVENNEGKFSTSKFLINN